jgi:hypothetical protein
LGDKFDILLGGKFLRGKNVNENVIRERGKNINFGGGEGYGVQTPEDACPIWRHTGQESVKVMLNAKRFLIASGKRCSFA